MIFGTLRRFDDDVVPLLLRLTLAVVIWPHGAQKALGWFGGYGFEATMAWLTTDVGVPPQVALLVIAAEFLGPPALVAGLFGRLAAAGIAGVMVGAVATTHWSNGFFMNWEGTAAGEGFQFHILVLGLAAALMLTGSGKLAADRFLWGGRLRPTLRTSSRRA